MVCHEKLDEQVDHFVGWQSEDGFLRVTAIHSKGGGKATLYRVVCIACAKDKELFPNEYFISTKYNLLKGLKPCGCSKRYRLTKEQLLVQINRVAEKKNVVFIGFVDGNNSRLELECQKHNHKWESSVSNFINTPNACRKCGRERLALEYKIPEKEVLAKCEDICNQYDYKSLGFPDGYKNQRSRFEYVCPKHGKQSARYNNFVNMGSRCPDCWKDKQKEFGNLYGYYPDRTTEQDYLYVLNFNNKFIKIGRSFDVKRRISQLKQDSKIKNIKKLYILTGTHQEIYDLEQELHNELRERGFSHNVDWSTECFTTDCIPLLTKLIKLQN